MGNILDNFSEEWCTGCCACMNICPVNAIKMELNSEGFIVPKIDSKLCIDCGKCIRTCHSYGENKKMLESENKVNESFVFKGDDEIRMLSSSGGLFYYLSKNVLDGNGVVYGAVYDSKSKIIRHESSDDYPLCELQRSKYSQSYIGDTYKKVLTQLKTGREVLFSGTPCQVLGLKSFLGREYDNLITVDFVCHGVPGTGIFNKAVNYEEQKNNKKITNVSFREKDLGWRNLVIKFYFEDNSNIMYDSQQHYYYFSFLQNLSLRKSCYNCTMPENHISDITLLDYWDSKAEDDKGLSGCIVNTEKGQAIFESLKSKSYEIDKILNSKNSVSHSKIMSYKSMRKIRDNFYEDYSNLEFKNFIDNKFKFYKNVVIFKNSIHKFLVKVRNMILFRRKNEK